MLYDSVVPTFLLTTGQFQQDVSLRVILSLYVMYGGIFKSCHDVDHSVIILQDQRILHLILSTNVIYC